MRLRKNLDDFDPYKVLEAGREAHKRYKERYPEKILAAQKKYAASDKGRARRLKWNHSERGRTMKRMYAKKYYEANREKLGHHKRKLKQNDYDGIDDFRI